MALAVALDNGAAVLSLLNPSTQAHLTRDSTSPERTGDPENLFSEWVHGPPAVRGDAAGGAKPDHLSQAR
ncbi:MAG: hypothetical protein RDU89_01135 [bacterium]|nr:hypothetical protein [bacterium]